MVIGGGLAGLASACALLDLGYRVTLVEKRPFLGGRAFSFRDPETGQEVDNGQHVFLGCCSAYIGFLERLGVLDRTARQDRLRVPVLHPDGRVGVIGAWPWLPAPLHLLPSFLAYPHLGWRDKLRVMAAFLHIWRTDRTAAHERLEGQTFLQWLEARGQSSRSVDRLWDLFVLPALNDASSAVSAASAFMVFQEGLLGGRHNADIGYSRVGLTALISDAAHAFIQSRGGAVLLDRSVLSLDVQEGSTVAVRLSGDQVLEADCFVSALAWDGLNRLLPAPWAEEPTLAAAASMEASPIVGIHVWYDRHVMDEEFVAVVDSPLQWVFNKSRIQGVDGPGQYVCVSLSGAWDYAPMSKEELRRLFTAELARVFPRAKTARIERFIVVKQLAATFRPTPGADGLRPTTATPIPNLFLAGDWVQTGWPSTMESAVRSGVQAAQAAAEAAS